MIQHKHKPFHKVGYTRSQRWADDHESLCKQSAAHPLKTYSQTQRRDPDPQSTKKQYKSY